MPPREPESTSLEAVADRLRTLRKSLGMNQRQFARYVGLGIQTYNNYEIAERLIRLDQALKVCRVTGVTLDWIYCGIMSGLPFRIAEEIQKQQQSPDRPRPRRSGSAS